MSVTFNLFYRSLPVSFHLADQDFANPEAYAAKAVASIAALIAAGLTIDQVKPGEGDIVEKVDCWVVGKSKNGKKVVHLYHSSNRFRIGAAYEEKIDTLPIKLAGAKQWVAAAPPERAEAESSGFLNKCPEFTVVMKPEFNEDGSPKLFNGGVVKNFFRVLDAPPVTPVATPAATPVVTPVATPVATPAATPDVTPPTVVGNPFNEASDYDKEIVAEICVAGANAYGRKDSFTQLLRHASEIAGKNVSGLLELSRPELGKLKAIVRLDELGLTTYGTTKWYPMLASSVGKRNKTSIYDFDVLGVDDIYSALVGVIENAKAKAK